MNENIYYFAYGSNMDISQMQERCVGSTLAGQAKLHGYRFLINTRGVATVVQENARIVYGMLWRITSQDETSLDDYEGVAWGIYEKSHIDVETPSGNIISALIYIARDNKEGRPRKGYMEKIADAAKFHSLPEEYIKELSLWLPAE